MSTPSSNPTDNPRDPPSNTNTNAPPQSEQLLPPSLQRSIESAEAERFIYEDSWTSTRKGDRYYEDAEVEVRPEVALAVQDSGPNDERQGQTDEEGVLQRHVRDGENEEQKETPGGPIDAPLPNALPPDLQRMVDREEQHRVLYEDSWTRTRPSAAFEESKDSRRDKDKPDERSGR